MIIDLSRSADHFFFQFRLQNVSKLHRLTNNATGLISRFMQKFFTEIQSSYPLQNTCSGKCNNLTFSIFLSFLISYCSLLFVY